MSDLVADLETSPARVTRVVLDDEADRPALAPGELMLVRDVLDSRVYDLAGRRSARVGEVWLEEHPDGRLEVAGLEVGVRVVLHRLGRRSSRPRLPQRSNLLDLAHVHLTSARGQAAQLATPDAPVHRLEGPDLAHLLTHLPPSSAVEVLHHVPEERAGAAVKHLHPHVLAQLGRALGGKPPLAGRRVRRSSGWRLYRPDGRSHQ